MTVKLTHAEVEDLAMEACTYEPCTPDDPCPAHRLMAHIEAQDQEIADLRTEMRVLLGELENHRSYHKEIT